jgi:hypothetical protein
MHVYDTPLHTMMLHMVGIQLISGLGAASVDVSHCDIMTLWHVYL